MCNIRHYFYYLLQELLDRGKLVIISQLISANQYVTDANADNTTFILLHSPIRWYTIKKGCVLKRNVAISYIQNENVAN